MKYIKKYIYHPLKNFIAKYYLKVLRATTDIKIIGITGSAGKTSVKEMTASILSLEGKTVWSKANIDPVYNIASTILRTSPRTKYLVLEMGIEYPNEMDFYLSLVKPDVGVITNIFPTHTKFLKDINGVFTEKSKLVRSLDRNDTAVLNSGDKMLLKLKGKLKCKIIWFGDESDIKSSSEASTPDYKTKFKLTIGNESKESVDVKLPSLGGTKNALAASAVCNSLGINVSKIKQGLESYSTPEHRMRIIKTKSGATIFDDSYNNNPQAAESAINNFLSVSKVQNKVVVFGDMLELGSLEEKYHRQLGEMLGHSNLSMLICVGHASLTTANTAKIRLGEKRVVHVDNSSQVWPHLKPLLSKKVSVLLKGSRSIGLDRVVDQLV